MFISNTYWILKAQPSNLDGTFFLFSLATILSILLSSKKQTNKKNHLRMLHRS